MRTIALCFLLALISCCFYHGGAWADRTASADKGKLIPWEDVNFLLPKYSIFTVRDVDTGKEFRVQRRAGSRHADVQPLTAKDTKIMKEIYNGEWSWKRWAIVVIHKKEKIAASP